jgi:peptidyl-prolyl cis-trans isomerase SurA
VVDRVLAVIDDDAIFLSDLERRVRPFEDEAVQQTHTVSERSQRCHELYQQQLERMVDDALIRRAATRAHVTVSEADVDQLVSAMARQRGGTAQDVYDALQREGISRQEYRQMVEAQALRLRVMNVRVRTRVNIAESDVQSAYRAYVREVQSNAPFRAAHVFVAFPDNPTASQLVAAQRRAEQVAQRAREGQDWAALAREFSDDASTRENGGDLGAVDPGDPNADPPPAWMLNALRDLAPGQTSNAVRGEQGYHVFRLVSRDAAEPQSLASVHDRLQNQLMERQMETQERVYLRELRTRSAVEVRLDR